MMPWSVNDGIPLTPLSLSSAEAAFSSALTSKLQCQYTAPLSLSRLVAFPLISAPLFFTSTH